MSQFAPRTSEQSQKRTGAPFSSDGCTLSPIEFYAACAEHDLDYYTGRVSRADADRKLYEAIRPISSWWAWVFWIAVRFGAASRYKHEARVEPRKPSDQARDV